MSLRLPFADGHAEAAGVDRFAPNAFIRIDGDGQVVLVMPYVEMGQGTYTSIPMLIAEELEVDLKQVRLEHAPPDEKRYGNPLLGGVQATGDSNAVRASWQPLREAGAVARTMLVAAAAQRWNVDPAACRAQAGEVLHPPTGRRAAYGELAADAARMPVPNSVALKRPQDFKLIGTPAKRLDTPAKVNGTAVYGIDVRPPGVKIATLAQSPVFGGRVKRVDDAAARAVNGVRQIVRLDDAVAVVADHMGAAKKGLAALVIEWDDGLHAGLDTKAIVDQLEQATLGPGAVAQNVGDVGKAMAGAATRVEAIYQLPFLAHAAMEPMNCTVHVRKDGCEVWVGNQAIARAQATAAKTTGLRLDQVVVHNHLIGGGFGRRLEVDGVTRAVEIAMQVDGPVKVVWTREEDIQHDMYRPYWFDRIAAGLDANGKPVAWDHRFAGPSIIARYLPPAFNNGLDPDTTEGAIDLAYALPNMHVEYVRAEPPGIPTAFWRSVGPSHNVFVVESFMDELAAAARQDAVAYRRALLDQSPRARAVLDLAAEKAGWGQPLPAGTGRGVALQHVFATWMAQVAEVEVAKDGGGARAPGGVRGRLRHRGQSRHRPGADPERDHVRHHRGAPRRDHAQEWSRRAGQLRQLPDPAHRRGAGGRGPHRPERGAAGRHGRGRHLADRAGGGQRDLRRDRQAPAEDAGRCRRAEAGGVRGRRCDLRRRCDPNPQALSVRPKAPNSRISTVVPGPSG